MHYGAAGYVVGLTGNALCAVGGQKNSQFSHFFRFQQPLHGIHVFFHISQRFAAHFGCGFIRLASIVVRLAAGQLAVTVTPVITDEEIG